MEFKSKVLKLLEEKIGSTFQYIGLGKDFLNWMSFAQELRPTINKWSLIKHKSSVVAKGKIKEMRIKPLTGGEHFQQLHIQQRNNIQNIQRSQKRTQKTNDSINIWAKGLNREFSNEEIKMLNKCLKQCPMPISLLSHELSSFCQALFSIIR